MTIQRKMNELFESKIVFYSMDFLANKLHLELELLENENTAKFNVDFLNVSTFYFINNTTDERKAILPPEADDYLELTSMNVSDSIINIALDCKEEPWLKQYSGCGKIILEIWSKLVVVEAEQLKINDDVFDL